MGLTEQQHAIRQTRITGSSAAPLMGYSPYVDPVSAWTSHTNRGGAFPLEMNPDIIAGNRLEDAIANWIADDLAITDLSEPGTIVMNEMFAATPDRLSLKENIGIQVKNHRPQVARNYAGRPGDAGKWDNNLIPLHINIQCQWEMLVCNETKILKDCDRWILAAFFGGGDRRVYWIKKDAALQDGLMLSGAIFWADHLNPEGPLLPPKDWPWVAKGRGFEPRKRKLPVAALEHAPIPFAEPLVPKIPFSEGT